MTKLQLLTYAQAAEVIKQGQVLAYPTEAVWGLGCDPFNEAAVHSLLSLKQRSVKQGLILVAGSVAQVEPYLQPLSLAQRQRVLATWPGAVTWLLPRTAHVPEWICGMHSCVAVRVSAHPDVQALCAAYGNVLVSTSANPSGKPAARTVIDTYAYFADSIAYMVGTSGGATNPSEIRDSITNQIIRGI